MADRDIFTEIFGCDEQSLATPLVLDKFCDDFSPSYSPDPMPFFEEYENLFEENSTASDKETMPPRKPDESPSGSIDKETMPPDSDESESPPLKPDESPSRSSDESESPNRKPPRKTSESPNRKPSTTNDKETIPPRKPDESPSKKPSTSESPNRKPLRKTSESPSNKSSPKQSTGKRSRREDDDSQPPCKIIAFDGSFSTKPRDPRLTTAAVRRPVTELKLPSFAALPEKKTTFAAPALPEKKTTFAAPEKKTVFRRPVATFKPIQRKMFKHKTPYVLAARPGEYVLTDGVRSLVRYNPDHWERWLKEDLHHVYLNASILYCVDETSHDLLNRVRAEANRYHPMHKIQVKVWEKDPDLGPCKLCFEEDCVRWLAIRGGVQKFFLYEIDVASVH